MRVLLVEDEADMAKLVARTVAARGFAVDQVSRIDDALEAARLADYAIVLLDRRLPDGDGAGAISALRAIRPGVPVVLLTALDTVAARVEGLDAGADDYLTKPFSFDELLARIRAALRRQHCAAPRSCACGNVAFDTAHRTVSVGGSPMMLGRRELMLLEALILRSGRVVQRAALADSAYGFGDDLQENTLDAAVTRLRRRLEAAGATARIHTVRGLGHMLRADPA